jgi:hypothetical protein
MPALMRSAARSLPERQISWAADPQHQLLSVRVVGPVAMREIQTAARAIVLDKAFSLGIPLVVDLREAEPLSRAASAAIDKNSRANPGDLVFGRIGVVANDDTIRAFAYQYKRLMGSYGTALRVFRDPVDALAWCERGERPTATTEDERWRRHERARRARESLARAARECVAHLQAGGDLLSDSSVQAVHDCVRSYTIACRSLGEREEVVQMLVAGFLRDLDATGTAHPAFASAIRDWVGEAYRAVA